MKKMIEGSKGFCLHHFGDICRRAETELNDKQKAEFYPLILNQMLERVLDDPDLNTKEALLALLPELHTSLY